MNKVTAICLAAVWLILMTVLAIYELRQANPVMFYPLISAVVWSVVMAVLAFLR